MVIAFNMTKNDEYITHIPNIGQENCLTSVRKSKNTMERIKLTIYITIRIIHLAPGQFCDDNPRYAGKVGVIDYIDSEGHLFGTWGGISILPDEDDFEVLDDK